MGLKRITDYAAATTPVAGTEMIELDVAGVPKKVATADILPNNNVTMARLADLATDRLIGRDTAGTGDPEALTVGGGVEFTGSGGIQRSALTGDVTASAGSNATTIANDAVTYAKMQNVSATDKLLGRSTAGAGDVEEIACTAAGRALLDDANAAAQRTTLGVASVDVQEFTASGTWTKPTGVTHVFVYLLGGGGGGGSGRKGAAGSVRCAGGGGAGGAHSAYLYRAADVGATESVVVGAAGTGGAAVSAADTNGNAGVAGGTSAFGQHIKATGGNPGAGGTNAAGAGGTAPTGQTSNGAAGGSASTGGSAGNAGSNSNMAGPGGGSGGGISSGDANSAGAAGGRPSMMNYTPTQGTGGAAETAGGNGANDTPAHIGSGGGGGGSSISGTNAGDGGDGGYSAGGGGGGAGLNATNNSGAGGDGGAGFVRVVSW